MDKEPNLNDNYGLQELGGSDFEIADHEPDIRGWTIKDLQGRTIGEVDELIFDPETRKVRYIVVDLEGNVLDLEPRDVLVPIGLAELHESDDEVILPDVTADQLRALPFYEKDRITWDTENKVRSVFTRAGAAAGAAGAAIGNAAEQAGQALTGDQDRQQFYEHEHFDEKKFYRKRPASLSRDVRITEKKSLPPSSGAPVQTGPDSTTMGGTTAGTGSGTTAGSTSAGTGATTGTGAGSSAGTSGSMGTGTSGTGTAGAGTTGGTSTTGTLGSGTSGTGSSGMGTTGTGTTSTGMGSTSTTGTGTTSGTGSTGTGTGTGGTGAGTTTGTPGTSSGTPPGRTSTDEDEKPHIET